MIGSSPEIELTEPMMNKVSLTVSLFWGDEACEFESVKEVEQFITKLRAASAKAFKPLIKV